MLSFYRFAPAFILLSSSLMSDKVACVVFINKITGFSYLAILAFTIITPLFDVYQIDDGV